MKNIKTSFPLYLGLIVFVFSLLAVSIKIGEKTTVQTGRLKASQPEANFSINFSQPNIVSLYFVSTKEVQGGDFVIKFNNREIELLPSTLTGQSGFITNGGDLDLEKGLFSFSAANIESPLKSGIIASFNIKGNSSEIDLSKILKIEFDAQQSRVIDQDTQPLNTSFKGYN